MKKAKLDEAVNLMIATTKDALQLLWDNIVPGQKKQILKNKEVKDMFDRYGVDYE